MFVLGTIVISSGSSHLLYFDAKSKSPDGKGEGRFVVDLKFNCNISGRSMTLEKFAIFSKLPTE